MPGKASDIFVNDRTARERIKNEIGRNFFVEAGAGSGKTHSLVERMTAMVKGGIDIRKICAITFTRAAAAEFYNRFQDNLSRELAEGKLTDEEKARVENALANIDLCFMGTIDSFCNMVLTEHPALAGIPSDCRMPDEAELRAIYKKEYSEIAKGNYGDELKEKQRRFSGAVENGSTVFFCSIGKFMDRRHAETVVTRPFDESPEKHFAGQIKMLTELLRKIDEDKENAVSGGYKKDPYKNIDKFYGKLKTIMNSIYLFEGTWDYRVSDIIGLLDTIYNGKDGLRIRNDWVWSERYSELLYRNTTAQLDYYYISAAVDLCSEYKEYQYSIAVDFLASAAAAVAARLKERGLLTYYDYLLYLRDMLKKDAAGDGKLIRHISERHSYYLIDEFQDTNPLQAEIFFYLAAEKPCEDWTGCKPRPGSLFVVGDPKQSIYRFRGADIASYKKVQGLFAKDEKVNLTRNHRSSKQLCEWFNAVFDKLIEEQDSVQSGFSEIPCDNNYTAPDSAFGGVFSYSGSDENARLCNIILKLIRNPEHKLFDGRTGKTREISYNDFMIITPDKNGLSGLTSEMNRRGIPVFTEGSVPFDKCPLLKELYRIINALAYPSDSTAVYGALTGKRFGIGQADILNYKRNGGRLSLYDDEFNENAAEDGSAVKLAMTALRTLFDKSARLTPSAVIERAVTDLRLVEKTGADNYEYYCFVCELIKAGENTGRLASLRDAAAFIHKLLYEDDDTYERCFNLASDLDCVHIANMHKVKGLEAEIVILANGVRSVHEPKLRVADDEEDPSVRKCWVFELSNTEKERKEGFTFCLSADCFPDKKTKESFCNTEENKRHVYVAATRARNALIIHHVADSEIRQNGRFEKEFVWKPLFELGGEIRDIGDIIENSEIADNSAPKISASDLLDKAVADRATDMSALSEATYTLVRPSKLKSKPAAADAQDEPAESGAKEDAPQETEQTGEAADKTVIEETRQRSTNAALAGTLIHRMMELIVLSRNRIDISQAARQIVGEFEGTDEQTDIPMLTEVAGRIRNGGFRQQGQMPDDILKELESAEEIYCEVPLCYEQTGAEGKPELYHGFIDLLYRKNGQWTIVDYKTNADGSGLEEKYKDQLDAYKSALKATAGIDAQAHIYHIDK